VDRSVTLELWRDRKVVNTEIVSNEFAYARQVDSFAHAVEAVQPFPVPGEEGWQNQIVLDAAYRSLSSGKTEDVEMLGG